MYLHLYIVYIHQIVPYEPAMLVLKEKANF